MNYNNIFKISAIVFVLTIGIQYFYKMKNEKCFLATNGKNYCEKKINNVTYIVSQNCLTKCSFLDELYNNKVRMFNEISNDYELCSLVKDATLESVFWKNDDYSFASDGCYKDGQFIELHLFKKIYNKN